MEIFLYGMRTWCFSRFFDVIKMSCLLSYWLLVLSVIVLLAGSTVLVESTPCLCPLMCPFYVSSDSGGDLVTLLLLMSSQGRYFPRRVSLSHVVFFVKPAAV